MEFDPSEEQRALCEAVRAFGRTLNDRLGERDRRETFDGTLWRRCAEFGLQGLPIPPEHGGSGQDLTTTLLAMEALGHGCRDNGLVFSLNAQLWAVELPLLRFGSDAQRRRWLPPLCRGERIAAHAMTEPASGSDAMALATRAVRDGDTYVLTGTKTFVTNGPVADLVLVFATVDPAARAAGVTAFLVERGAPGLTLSGPIAKMGLRTSPMGEVILDGCRVPAEQRLGAEGAGMGIFTAAMEWERSCIFAAHLGAMERLLEETIAYAKSRRQFGQAIGKFAAVADAIVDAKVALEAGRLLLYRVGARKDAGRDAVLDAAIAKLFVSEAHVAQAMSALRLHGGYGYTTELGIERELRDAIPGTLYSGTSEMQRKIIARLLGL
ncbi:acyl-CoA dehydrogenase family protein [Anaeromyxobacter oryzisoli]|uniref:acyl-CoA dehydrogenase family protein n=1 Tax=Anaeromyxobacter oryzisoli TaxID=2925408 RepID=UPI001F59AABB|nr:acyl-CoA dehydrogenase family protein [Anaeromyxobacter sp. SG63]